MHKVRGCGGGSTRLHGVASSHDGRSGSRESRMQALSSLSPFPLFIQSGCPCHGLVLLTFREDFTPQLLLSGKAFTAIIKPKVHLVDILGISKSS